MRKNMASVHDGYDNPIQVPQHSPFENLKFSKMNQNTALGAQDQFELMKQMQLDFQKISQKPSKKKRH